MKAFKYLLTPFFFATYAFLSLLVNNITEVDVGALTALLFSTLIAGLALILLRIFVRDAEKASIIATIAVVLIFSFGHVSNLLAGFFSGSVLFVIWITVFGGCAFWVLRKANSEKVASVSKYLRTVGVILLVFPVYNLASFGIYLSQLNEKTDNYIQKSFPIETMNGISASKDEAMPDIYYIILDAYSRPDILQAELGYDDSVLPDFLETQGFYVARASMSNYSNTRYSLSSSLNMTHIANLPENLDGPAQYQRNWMLLKSTSYLVKNNLIAKILQNQGFEFVSFNTGFGEVEMTNSDHYMISPEITNGNSPVSAFDILLFNTTVGTFLNKNADRAPLESLSNDHRERILYTLAHVSDFADQEESFFVYAHVLSPHPPFVFNAQGEATDACIYTDTDIERDPSCYLGQVAYLNELVMKAVTDILEKSDTPPIIIIQGDHGVNCYVQSEDIEERVPLCFPILNAYYFPDANYQLLYPDITPINSFRIVLNQYFNANLPLLSDKSFFYELADKDVKFVDICEGYGYCP
ncbi:MAG: sulfatase-like hydrolase/transferase [Anaerolineales bacterium]|nr:sulfatase-like hydrolase/transferase [Anaerolineales bacterium]